jgi:hypothetical protein
MSQRTHAQHNTRMSFKCRQYNVSRRRTKRHLRISSITNACTRTQSQTRVICTSNIYAFDCTTHHARANDQHTNALRICRRAYMFTRASINIRTTHVCIFTMRRRCVCESTCQTSTRTNARHNEIMSAYVQMQIRTNVYDTRCTHARIHMHDDTCVHTCVHAHKRIRVMRRIVTRFNARTCVRVCCIECTCDRAKTTHTHANDAISCMYVTMHTNAHAYACTSYRRRAYFVTSYCRDVAR